MDSGSVELVNGDSTIDWSTVPRWKRAAYVARVHQDPRQGTAAGMTVWENFRLFAARRGIPSPLSFVPLEHDRQWFAQRLTALGLPDRLDTRIADLSQGQRQLLALELAMLRRPAFLLLDEHTASLDRDNARRCLEATVRLSREQWTTVLMVTHNLADALHYGDRLVVLRDGRILENLDANQKRSLDLQKLIDLCGYVV
jgi:putative ABC transport system ATP-binding protein